MPFSAGVPEGDPCGMHGAQIGVLETEMTVVWRSKFALVCDWS